MRNVIIWHWLGWGLQSVYSQRKVYPLPPANILNRAPHPPPPTHTIFKTSYAYVLPDTEAFQNSFQNEPGGVFNWIRNAISKHDLSTKSTFGRVVRWCWMDLECWGVLLFCIGLFAKKWRAKIDSISLLQDKFSWNFAYLNILPIRTQAKKLRIFRLFNKKLLY